MTNYFITKQWGFGPKIWGIVGFRYKGNCLNLMRELSSGDRIVIVATKGKEVEPQFRGKLLGMVEVDSSKMVDDYTKFISPDECKARHNYKGKDFSKGFRWPHALKITAAWEFTPPQERENLIKVDLSGFNAVLSADKLDAIDKKIIDAFPRKEVIDIYGS